MSVLLLAEVTGGELSMDATAKAVTAVAKLGDVTCLRGAGCRRGGG
jgi:electron transfer flavoprotein alpha subunit